MPALDRGGIWGLHDTGQQVAVARQAGDQARLARTLPLGMPQHVQVLPEQVKRNLTGPVIVDEVVLPDSIGTRRQVTELRSSVVVGLFMWGAPASR